MTNFERISGMSVDDLAKFLDQFGWDNTPWVKWFDTHYCKKCAPLVIDEYGRTAAPCELGDDRGCEFFKGEDIFSYDPILIRKWLESEVDNGTEID